MKTLQNMENFKNYFKFPLKMWTDFDVKVFTDDNKMAFDWLINVPREVKQALVDRINGVNTNPYKECGEHHDRDINAAKNIKCFGLHPQALIGIEQKIENY